MSDRMKREHIAAWDAFAERCAIEPVEIPLVKLTVVKATKRSRRRLPRRKA